MEPTYVVKAGYGLLSTYRGMLKSGSSITIADIDGTNEDKCAIIDYLIAQGVIEVKEER